MVAKGIEALQGNSDWFNTKSMVTAGAAGSVISGIGASVTTLLGFPNGWVLLGLSVLFGSISTLANKSESQGRMMLALYCAASSLVMFWHAAQSTPFTGAVVNAAVMKVGASEVAKVYIDKSSGMYVAIHPDHGEHRAPAWAVNMYCEQASEKSRRTKSPWSSIKF